MNDNKRRFCFARTSLSVAIAMGSVFVAAEESKYQLEEVVVTAQKKVESLQDTPIAISAFSADKLEDLGAHSASDIGEYTPNAIITPSLGSSFNIRMTIRGQGTAEPSLAVDPKVGIYLDGAYIARNAGAVFDIVDLERIEVLRGPQGTLWGKNTTGGAINIITARPDGEFGFKQQLSVGNFGYYRSVTTVDTPEAAGLSAKFSYALKGEDGWADNTSPKGEKELGSEKSNSYRLALRWDATEDLSFDYAYDNTDGEATPDPFQPAKVHASTAPDIGTFILADIPGSGSTVPTNTFALMADLANGKDRLDEFSLDAQGKEEVDISGHNLTVTWDVQGVVLKSISAYREYEADLSSGLDMDGGAYMATDGSMLVLPIFHTVNEKEQDQFSQEFQAVGAALDGRLNYVLGLYHFEEEGEEINPWLWTIQNGDTNYLLDTYGTFYNIDSESDAVYGQVSYDVGEQWTLTVGGRHTKDDKKLVLLEVDPILDADEEASDSWSKTTGSFTASYQLSDEMNFYGKISQGYASGLYNPSTVDRNPTNPETTEAALIPADPEESTSYEIGMKSELWDRRLRLNAAIFYNDNKNLQATDFKDGQRQTFNTGESTSTGLEFDLIALLGAGFTLNAAYGYLDVDFENKDLEPGEEDREQTSPKYTGNIGVQYDYTGMEWGVLTARLDLTASDEVGFSSSQPEVKSDKYELLNGRIGLSEIAAANGTLRVAMWGRNLTDEEYIVHGANVGFYTGYTWGTPRTYGLDLTWEY